MLRERPWGLRGRAPLLAIWMIVLAALIAPPSRAAGKGEPGPVVAARVELGQPSADLELFRNLDLDVDGVFDGWARVYLLEEEAATLRSLGYQVSVLWREPLEIPESWMVPAPRRGAAADSIPASYHTYDTLTSELQAIAATYPDLVRLSTIGQSVQERQLWMVKITDNPDLEEDEPAVCYIAAMHGDEVVGKELLVGLMHLLLEGYGTDPRMTDLVDHTEIWLMPSMNPDGTALGQRYNANGYDLNRSFPDWYSDPDNTPDGRQREVQAVMAWTEAQTIDLSANMHGGALVVNYPWDNNPTQTSRPSPTPDPDDPAFLSISLTYSSTNLPMYNGAWPQGVTNGADWYVITGGMQDWNYAWYGNWQVTLELSNSKWPPPNQLPDFWDDNRESMLAYFERVHEGVRGVVTDADSGAPLAAEIYLDDNPFPAYTDPDVGDYHRIVLPDSYTMRVEAAGYDPQTFPVTVSAGSAARYDVQLQPAATNLQPYRTRLMAGPIAVGWLTPGEATDLILTLENRGAPASNVRGHLIPTGWDAEILRADAIFPDIPLQGTGRSVVPHFEFSVDSDVPQGRKVGLAVEWTADQGKGTTEPFFLDVGEPLCDETSAGDVHLPIQDYQLTTSEITIGETLLIDTIEVAVDISHSYIGDLTLTLRSPAGTSVLLHNRSGGGSSDIVGTYGVDLVPAEPLSVLEGEPAEGIWTLEVDDQASGDTGWLNTWSLEICAPSPAGLPEMRFRDLTADAEGVLLRWWPYPGLQSYQVYRATDPSSSAHFIDVTGADTDPTDTEFVDTSSEQRLYYLVTGVSDQGEGP